MLRNKHAPSASGGSRVAFPAPAPLMLWSLNREGLIGWVDPGQDPDPAWTPDGLIGRSVFAVLDDFPDLLKQVCLALSGLPAGGELQRGDRSWACRLIPIRSGGTGDPQVLCLFTETSLQGRLWVQEALTGTAAALREARGFADMPPLITRQLQELLGAERTALCLGSPPDIPYRILFSWGDWESPSPRRRNLSALLVDPQIIQSLNGLCRPLGELAILERGTDPVYGAALAIGDQHLGALWIGRGDPFSPLEYQLVHKLAEMAASALQRARQHELTSRRLERLSALHNVERAISGSFNLNLTLHLILEQVVSQLEVDAADVVLAGPSSGEMRFAEGLGFWRYQPKSGISKERARLIQDALLRRDLVSLPDLPEARPGLARVGIFSQEGFQSYHAVPLIAKGRALGVLEVYHKEPLRLDREWYAFLRTLGSQAAVAMDSAALVEDLRRTNLELDQAYSSTLEGWVRALDLRDSCTSEHTQRVVERSLKLARAVGIPDQELEHFRRGALLHDIGKLAVPDQILKKSEPLSEEDWAVMRRHPVYAREMLEPIAFLRPALPIPTAHHEKWDGSGYPDGLRGTEIPLAARVFALIDVWDALSSPRPYRPAWPEERVNAYIRGQAGKHFDPQVVAAWEKVFGIG